MQAWCHLCVRTKGGSNGFNELSVPPVWEVAADAKIARKDDTVATATGTATATRRPIVD